MSDKNIIIGIDNGNANTKTPHVSFVSGLNTHDLRPPMAVSYTHLTLPTKA